MSYPIILHLYQGGQNNGGRKLGRPREKKLTTIHSLLTDFRTQVLRPEWKLTSAGLDNFKSYDNEGDDL